MAELPTGTVTFLFTDLEGSTRLWEERPGSMEAALVAHDAILQESVQAHGGVLLAEAGDGMVAVFASAVDAVAAGLGFELQIAASENAEVAELLPRVGLHTGEGVLRADGRYVNQPLNRCARLMAAAHGGEMLVSESVEPLVRGALPPGVELVALGAHRLRDLANPIAVFQVVHPELRREFPPLRTLDALPGNLPLQVSSFIGREHELARASKALEASRVVTLTGVGGVGKTRLACQVAAEVLPRFPDGAWLCRLEPVREPDEVVAAVAAVFRVSARPGLTLEESLIGYLRDEQLLLVVDNCEHLLQPLAQLVATLEETCRDVRILATSREGLNVGGEQILMVPSLPVPDTTAPVAAVAASDAARLFVDRARAQRADFTIDISNAAGVAQICRRLDGLPLAIELAAARIVAMTPDEIANRLDRRFPLLVRGDRAAVERHQTLRAAVDWSYDLLSVSEQRLLARLAVFAGGCTLEAVEAVCSGEPVGADDIVDLLANLVARSLVVAEPGAPTRYRLLETIRQYSEERLAETGGTDELRARHADHYIELSERAFDGLFGPDQIAWGDRLSGEHDNLDSAMAFALDAGDVDRGMRLLRAQPSSTFQVNELVVFDPGPVLATPGAAEHPAYPAVLVGIATRAAGSGDVEVALELLARAVQAEQLLGSRVEDSGINVGSSTARAGIDVGISMVRAIAAMSTGAFAEAARHCFDAADRARESGQFGRAATTLALGAMVLAWVDAESALERAADALDLARGIGMPSAIDSCLLALAIASAPRDTVRACQLMHEADNSTSETFINLLFLVFLAGSLSEWYTTLDAARRLFRLDRRSGVTPPGALVIVFNFVARALADDRPLDAAIVQGIPLGVVGRSFPILASSTAITADVAENRLLASYSQARRHATLIIADAIGEARVRELCAQGESMNREQAIEYTSAMLDQYLAENADAVR